MPLHIRHCHDIDARLMAIDGADFRQLMPLARATPATPRELEDVF